MITIKIGGSVVDNLHPSTILDIKKVVESEGVILVHGGGKEVTKVCKQLGKEPKFVTSPSGIKSRYTDKETVEIFTMVMAGRINKAIVQMLQKNGINAIGLSGVDGKIIQAERKKKLL
jgi:acetylglutamate/LysW-gamma-L-alpha-aminoadipate kinase